MPNNLSKDDPEFAFLADLDGPIAVTFRRIGLSADLDPVLTCVSGRKFLECVLVYLDSRHGNTNAPAREPLFNAIKRLNEGGTLPRLPTKWAHSLRELGNIGSHADQGGQEPNSDDVDEVIDVAKKLARWLRTTMPVEHENVDVTETEAPPSEEPVKIAPKVDTPTNVDIAGVSVPAFTPTMPLATTPKVPPDKANWSDLNGYRLVIFCRQLGRNYILLLRNNGERFKTMWLNDNLPPIKKTGKYITNGLEMHVTHVWHLLGNQYLARVRWKERPMPHGFQHYCWVDTKTIWNGEVAIDDGDRDILLSAIASVENARWGGMPDGGTAVRRADFYKVG